MAAITKREKLAKATLYEIGYKYLCDNFHKFDQDNKIKVAISVISIFEKDGSKTKPEFHTHFTVILDGPKASHSNLDGQAEPSLSAANEPR